MEKILLTPDVAKKMLENNYKHNRRIRPSVVSKYAADIKEQRWNSEVSRFQDPIIISKDGYLLNGQHRCSAVIQANMPILIYVEKDVNEDVFQYLDNGEKRSTKDYVDLPNSHAVAALGKIMYAVENGTAPLTTALLGKTDARKSGTTATRQQILGKINEDTERVVEYVRLGMRGAIYLGNKKGYLATALFIIDFVERGDMLSRFVDELSAIAPTSQPVIVLRSYVARCLSSSNFKSDCKWLCGCVFLAYENFRAGKDIISFNKGNRYFSQYDKYVEETRKKIKED